MASVIKTLANVMKHAPLFVLNVSLPPSVRDVSEDITGFLAIEHVVPPVFTTRAILVDVVLASPGTTMNRIATKVQLNQHQHPVQL